MISIPVPVEFLTDSLLNVKITAKMPGYGNAGNAIEPDFSLLTIETTGSLVDPPVIVDPHGPDGGPHAVPLPPVFLPAGLMITGLMSLPKQRIRRWLRL